tara:strand:+ start:860 stop:1888 length:1029 start_codon:yes stop_codon:yes gene_type:complete
MIKVGHIFAKSNGHNSGDVILSIATKQYFKEIILKKKMVTFTDINCRENDNFNEENILKLNKYDYILVGAGGLILPDTFSNDISCWQWIIKKELYSYIKPQIFVISIGYNLFFNQNMNMYDRESNAEDKKRLPIFCDNITELIKKSKVFTLRHKNDVNCLNSLLNYKFSNKLRYQMCPSVWYVNKYWKHKIDKNSKKYLAIEIKDDREWRRYYKISKETFYEQLKMFVIYCLNKGIDVCVLFHDKSRNFYNYLHQNNININFLSNCSKTEQEIFENYSKIHTIVCTAGHSQMISYGLGINIISLITHPKLKNFCEEINDNNWIDVNKTKNVYEEIKNKFNSL